VGRITTKALLAFYFHPEVLPRSILGRNLGQNENLCNPITG